LLEELFFVFWLHLPGAARWTDTFSECPSLLFTEILLNRDHTNLKARCHFTGTHPGMPGLNNALPQIVPVPCSPDPSHVLIMSRLIVDSGELR